MKILKWIEWKIDFHFCYFLYKPARKMEYHAWMREKWGKKYSDLEEK